MKFLRIITIIFSSVGLVSCVASSGSSGYQGQPNYSSLSGHWLLSSLNNSGYPGSRISLQFDNNKVSGFSGCNRYFASTASQGSGILNFGFIGSTKKLCVENQASKLESSYLRSLRQVRSYQLSGNRLILEGNGTYLVFIRG